MTAPNLIYLDHAASTAVSPPVQAAMADYFTKLWGNPNSIHAQGRLARSAVEKARRQVARLLPGAAPDNIIFTGGGTEANNLAIVGAAQGKLRQAGSEEVHLVTTAVEHSSVLGPMAALEERGAQVTYLEVDRYGRVDPRAVLAAVKPATVLISVMLANNEVGTLQPVAEIGQLLKQLPNGLKPLFHTDAIQGAGQVSLDVERLGVDLLSLSGHKFHAPKGVGALYVRSGVRQHLTPLLFGGGQEGRLRPGTENVPGIVALGAAAELARQAIEDDDSKGSPQRLARLRDGLIARVQAAVPDAELNGHPVERLPNNAHFTIPGVASDSLLIQLDMAGVAASSGSACAVGAVEPSHVLQAMGRSRQQSQWGLRLTLGADNDEGQIEKAAAAIGRAVARIRRSQTREGSPSL